jgi:hypothetical protein
MVCVGSTGIGPPRSIGLGATAASLRESASCPVATIRGDHPTRSLNGCIAVVIDGSLADDAALRQATQEARLRNASVLAIGARHLGANGISLEQPEDKLRSEIQRCPDVAVQLVAARGGVSRFLADTAHSVQLAVIGRGDGEPTRRFAGPVRESLVETAGCSLLVVPTQILAESLTGSNVVGSKAQ